MPVFRIGTRNVLFIHVPKTGGSSVEKFLASHAEMALHDRGGRILRPTARALFAPGLVMQHFHGEILRTMFPKSYFDYAFTIVRNPETRLVSEYGHAVSRGRADALLPFSLWARAALRLARAAPCLGNNHFRAQSDFPCFNAEVFRFEEGLEAILRQVCLRLGLSPPREIPHERRSPVAVTRVSGPVRALIAHAYASDYANFGYAASPAGESRAPQTSYATN